MACRHKGGTPVIYISKREMLSHLSPDENWLAISEEEEAWNVTPEKFEQLCEGYISLDDAASILNKLEIRPPVLFDLSLFDYTLAEIETPDAKTIQQFYALAHPLLRKR